jgi:hypothetical protein
MRLSCLQRFLSQIGCEFRLHGSVWILRHFNPPKNLLDHMNSKSILLNGDIGHDDEISKLAHDGLKFF